ncbi:hypothetical protein ACQEVF_57460 [Nonomuraea polychroma]|uniref:hypothetical protein n=1 Tax=Nonomuraea polychroma TaxID=46176 RepID=UPI003D89BA7A
MSALHNELMTLTDPTLGLLVDIAENLSRASVDNLLLRANLNQYATDRSSRHSMLFTALTAARRRTTVIDGWDCDPDEAQQAHRALLDFTRRLVETRRLDPTQIADISEAVRADGYELVIDADTGRARLLATDPAPVPLPPQITALEAELEARGYHTVSAHYRQAVDNLVHHNYEAANASLRPALEELVVRLAEDHASYTVAAHASQGGAAITYLINNGYLLDADGGLFLRGLWRMLHTNGPHPGQTDADEARFRIVTVTAAARFLLKRFAPRR